MPEPKKLDESINDDLSSKKEEETKHAENKQTLSDLLNLIYIRALSERNPNMERIRKIHISGK